MRFAWEELALLAAGSSVLHTALCAPCEYTVLRDILASVVLTPIVNYHASLNRKVPTSSDAIRSPTNLASENELDPLQKRGYSQYRSSSSSSAAPIHRDPTTNNLNGPSLHSYAATASTATRISQPIPMSKVELPGFEAIKAKVDHVPRDKREEFERNAQKAYVDKLQQSKIEDQLRDLDSIKENLVRGGVLEMMVKMTRSMGKAAAEDTIKTMGINLHKYPLES